MEQKPKVRLPSTVHMSTIEKWRDILAWHILDERSQSFSSEKRVDGRMRDEQLGGGESPQE